MAVHRDRVEALLEGRELELIATMCAEVHVPFARWTDAPQIARPWLLIAIHRRVEQLRERGWSLTHARDDAAAFLGLDPETPRQWRRRWRRQALQRGQSVPDVPRAAAAS